MIWIWIHQQQMMDWIWIHQQYGFNMIEAAKMKNLNKFWGVGPGQYVVQNNGNIGLINPPPGWSVGPSG